MIFVLQIESCRFVVFFAVIFITGVIGEIIKVEWVISCIFPIFIWDCLKYCQCFYYFKVCCLC